MKTHSDDASAIDRELYHLAVEEISGSRDRVDGGLDVGTVSVQEKLNEYKVLVAPVEQAIREMQLARGMLRARAEDEINALSPALGALAEALGISTLDLLTSGDRSQFLHDAVQRTELPVEEIRQRIAAAGAEPLSGRIARIEQMEAVR